MSKGTDAPAKPVIRVNDKTTKPAKLADIVEVEPGIYSVLIDGESFEVTVNGTEVDIGNTRFRVEVDDPRKWNAAGASHKSGGREAIKTPMPGKVVRLLVKEGDEVVKGQGLIVVEAMKMQNEMKAPARACGICRCEDG